MKHIVLSFCLASAVLPAAAQALSVAPAPGLWQTEGRMTVNGQDIGALMRSQMQAMLQSLPPDQRAMAEQMMKGRGMADPGAPRQYCLTAAEAARRGDPKQWLAELQKDSPRCRYEPVQVRGATVSFKGRCEDPEGFTGDVTGEMTLTDPKSWTGRWSGKGRMNGADEMPGVDVGPDGRVDFGWAGTGRWLAADCGNVPPR